MSILVIFHQNLLLLSFNLSQMFYRDIAFNAAHNAAAFALHMLSKGFDLPGGFMEQIIELPPKNVVPNGNVGQ